MRKNINGRAENNVNILTKDAKCDLCHKQIKAGEYQKRFYSKPYKAYQYRHLDIMVCVDNNLAGYIKDNNAAQKILEEIYPNGLQYHTSKKERC